MLPRLTAYWFGCFGPAGSIVYGGTAMYRKKKAIQQPRGSLWVLEKIRDYVDRNRRPPTIRELMVSCGFTSTNGARYHLKQLERAGLLVIIHGISRGVVIVEPKKPAADWSMTGLMFLV